MKKLMAAILMAAAFRGAAAAQDALSAGDPLAGSGPFSSDLQDLMETSDGYLSPENTMKVRTDFDEAPAMRDAVISAPAPALKPPPAPAVRPEDRPGLPSLPTGHYKVTFAGESGPMGSYVWPMDKGSARYAREYVLLGVALASGQYDGLLPRLEAAGFRFAGEKTSYSGRDKSTVLLGWAPYSAMARISGVPGVQNVSVEKKSSGIPMKARVRFTLKVPFQNKPSAFVPRFIKELENGGGFTAENWFRLPQKSAGSKFSVFDVTGTMAVDMIGDLSRSPFVASVEFNDSAL